MNTPRYVVLLTALVLAFAGVRPSRGALNASTEPNQLGARPSPPSWNAESERALRDQIAVGKQRYAARQQLRRELVSGLQANLRQHQETAPGLTPTTSLGLPVAGAGYEDLALWLLLLLAAALVFRRLSPQIGRLCSSLLHPWSGIASAGAPELATAATQERFFSELTAAFCVSPAGTAQIPSSAPVTSAASQVACGPAKAAKPEPDPPARFLSEAPKSLGVLRGLIDEVGRTSDPVVRQRLLSQLHLQVCDLKTRSGSKGLLPVWQMAGAVEGLLHVLSDQPGYATPSALQTVAGALDLLKALCRADLRPDLAINPPVRFLAVDDDPISRHAVSFALEKAFRQCDLAPDGPAGLALAKRNAYDTIFLDIEMPGMNGFELCSKIQATQTNQATPVVFVTGHSDFESRTQSTHAGARELIAKPFLACELAVKALTLSLRRRLQADLAGVKPPAKPEASVAAHPDAEPPADRLPPTTGECARPARDRTPQAQATGRTPSPSPRPASSLPGQSSTAPATPTQSVPGPLPARPVLVPQRAPALPPKETPLPSAASAAEPATRVLKPSQPPGLITNPPRDFAGLRTQLHALSRAPDQATRKRILNDLCLRTALLTSGPAFAPGGAAFRLAVSAEGLLKKLLDQPLPASASALEAAARAFELLETIARVGCRPDLAAAPVRVLVADDDPVARRAVAMAVQVAFAKPESVESGEAAMRVAEIQPFDVIFLDILMPTMDGFKTCSAIRQTHANARTPVVFITAHLGVDARDAALHCGGNGFILKPPLPIEVTLTTLTLALAGRLEEPQPDRRQALACGR